MNPQSAMKVLASLNTFRSNHPKFAGFVQLMLKRGFDEGTVIEVTVTRPGEDPITSNMKVTQSDLELFSSLKDLGV
ncbi:MAG: hypothetical protein IKO16_00375 [Lachnospiraceae bacterium]|nr:hypothetical protein [Lachnospiraceae bacterium]